MSKVKKIMAMLLTLAMVLGMSMTTMAAAEDVTDFTGMKSDITINGLSESVTTEVTLVPITTLQYDAETNAYSWALVEGVQGVALNDGVVSITNKAQLRTWAINNKNSDATVQETGTSHTFVDQNIGAYAIVAVDDKADYDITVANTYDRENTPAAEGKLAVKDANVTAKASTHTITKTADEFVNIGEDVDFTVTAIFPAYHTYKDDGSVDGTLEKFVLTDTPDGILIDATTLKVMLADVDVTAQVEAAVDPTTGVMTLDFGNLITEENSGKQITVTYTGEATKENYTNTVTADAGPKYEYKPGDSKGYSARIALEKVDAEDDRIVLNGAEFNVTMGTEPENLLFVEEVPGVYHLASKAEQASASATIAAPKGTVEIRGLDEGTYNFIETKAPDGYTINTMPVIVKIEYNESNLVDGTDANGTPVKFIQANGMMTDTKLSALPATGGIGTTIFTIGGCLIMVIAAALFFASRKKHTK